VVQWQDEWGYWQDVEGWQGELDQVKSDDDGAVAGQKTWWVSMDDLGRGPFRWRVYRSRGGYLLATSDEFYLPAVSLDKLVVEVALAP
jgi:hypothetical protein